MSIFNNRKAPHRDVYTIRASIAKQIEELRELSLMGRREQTEIDTEIAALFIERGNLDVDVYNADVLAAQLEASL